MAPKVVKVGTPNSVYVGRPTIYGSPWRAGTAAAPTRRHAVQNYERWLDGAVSAPDGRKPPTAKQIQELQGQNLQCFCGPDVKYCHAQVLLRRANKKQGGLF